mmetsp:Transcript_14634/g.32304  ORF Transcript_14634/g.32304 Transcript_14634/m.32304 type:complete len:200 (-) Transcript_14634:688-1287(-)
MLGHVSHYGLGELPRMVAWAALVLVRAAPGLLRMRPALLPVAEAGTAVINVQHLHMPSPVDHLVLDNGLRRQRHGDLDHLAGLLDRHRHWDLVVGWWARLWHRHVALLVNVLWHHMRMAWHGDLDHLWRIVDGDIHDVVDNFGWRCRDWHMDWHRDMLDVRDGVVMWPVSHLGVAPNHPLVAAISLLVPGPNVHEVIHA